MSDLLVPRRFNGPVASANGGWVAGALAGLLLPDHDHARGWPAITVTLRRPPPLDTPVPVTDGAAVDADGVVASAEVAGAEGADIVVLDAVAPVHAAEAEAARSSYAGLEGHPFPTCFACGPDREEGDGLRIFPGRVADDAEGRVRVASTWTPHPSHAEDWHAYADDDSRASLPVTWAALDCVGGWAGDLLERPMVLGRMTARIEALPVIGREYVVVGGARSTEGRKTLTASTLYDAGGRVVAVAAHVWITIDPADFNRL